jgi:hypothetical protein
LKRIIFLASSVLSLLLSAGARCDDNQSGTLTGKFLLNTGSPMARGTVFIFNSEREPRPALGKYWKIPDETADTDTQGKFKISLPAGTYYIAAIQRQNHERLGPPAADDYFYASNDSKGRLREYVVKQGRTTSIGIIKGVAPAKSSYIAYRRDMTGIEGTVRDKDGKPVERALVIAYDNPAMQGPPLFSSPRTGSDGKYLLGVEKGGSFYLKARDVYGGGKPQVGGFLGVLGSAEEPEAVVVKTKEVTRNINITIDRYSEKGFK